MTTPTLASVRPAEIGEGQPGRAVSVEWTNGDRTSLNVLWLRDNCPTGGDKASAIRSFSLGQLDPEVSILEARVDDGDLVVGFSDGHRARFGGGWLADTVAPRAEPATELWRSRPPQRLQFADVVTDGGHLRLLEQLVSHGAAVVVGLTADLADTETLAARLGRIRETDFGRVFDIVSEPDVWELSQSSSALDPHTDDPYRYTPSGMSLLHCVEASPTGGGASILVDGFSVGGELRESDPGAFEVLSTVPLPWIRRRVDDNDQGDPVDLVAWAPVFRLDGRGGIAGVRFHERSLGIIPGSPDHVDAVYRALMAFIARIRSPDHQWIHRLEPGEALVFDNQRVLHGRTAFEGDEGRRHLRLCTVDRDQVHSRLRLLRRHLRRGDPDQHLPAGNLS